MPPRSLNDLDAQIAALKRKLREEASEDSDGSDERRERCLRRVRLHPDALRPRLQRCEQQQRRGAGVGVGERQRRACTHPAAAAAAAARVLHQRVGEAARRAARRAAAAEAPRARTWRGRGRQAQGCQEGETRGFRRAAEARGCRSSCAGRRRAPALRSVQPYLHQRRAAGGTHAGAAPQLGQPAVATL